MRVVPIRTFGDDSTPAPPIDPDTGLQVVDISASPLPQEPIWPLLIIMGVVGYFLYWAGGHK